MKMSWGVIVVNVVSVVLWLAFTWLPSRSDCVTDQRLASSFKIFRVNGQDVLFMLCQVTGDRVDGAKVDGGCGDGSSDRHDGNPRDHIGLASLDVVVHDGAATVVLRMVPGDCHRRLVAV